MTDETREIKRKVKNALDKERYQHTLGVAYTASSLAMRYGVDFDKAFLAGILHDCAKNIPNDDKYAMCKKYKIKLTKEENEVPALVHSKLGAYLAEHEYGIQDKEIINAVKYHTTGRPGMSLYEKIIFVADYIEPGRNSQPNLQEIRQMAFVDLNRALLRILSDTVEYLNSKSAAVMDPMTKKTFDYYNSYVNGGTDDRNGDAG